MDNLAPVTLVVKAPNQKIGDQTIECALDWTVKKLKQHLSSVYPSKPTETQQRIIYSGKLLQDDVKLKDVLRQYEADQQTHTVHLVCSPSTTDAAPPASSKHTPTPAEPGVGGGSSAEGLRYRHNASASGPPSALRPDQPVPPTYNSVMSSVHHSLPNPLMYGAVPGSVATAMMYPGASHGMPAAMLPGGPGFMSPVYSAEQMMWMQQTYAQYMAHYMQYYQHPGLYQQNVPVPPTEPQANQLAANELAGNGVRAEAAGANERPAQQAEVVRMNAQGGAMIEDDDDDEMRNHDWLDWVYTFIRFILLLSILYFYSSFDRFMATMGLVFVIYMYQAGWFHLNRRNAHAAAAAARVPPRDGAGARVPAGDGAGARVPPRDGLAEGQVDGVAGDDAVPAENDDYNAQGVDDAVPTAAGPAAAQPGILSLSWTFIVSFFSSLAPQQPPPVNIN